MRSKEEVFFYSLFQHILSMKKTFPQKALPLTQFPPPSPRFPPDLRAERREVTDKTVVKIQMAVLSLQGGKRTTTVLNNIQINFINRPKSSKPTNPSNCQGWDDLPSGGSQRSIESDKLYSRLKQGRNSSRSSSSNSDNYLPIQGSKYPL